MIIALYLLVNDHGYSFSFFPSNLRELPIEAERNIQDTNETLHILSHKEFPLTMSTKSWTMDGSGI